MENSGKSLAKVQQSQLYCWQQTVNFSRRSNSGFCDEINKEFETSEKYNFLVSQTMRPIAKSLSKTLNLKSTIFEYRSEAKSPTLNTHKAFLCLAQSFLVTRAQAHTSQDSPKKL